MNMNDKDKTAKTQLKDVEPKALKAKEISEKFASKLETMGFCDEKDLSNLAAAVWDIYESFHEIYHSLLPEFLSASPNDRKRLGDLAIDIKFELQHVSQHIKDGDKTWLKLANFLHKDDH